MSRWKRQLTTFLLAVCMVISLLPSGYAVSVPGAAGDTAESVDEVETLSAPVVMDAEAEEAAETAAEPVAEEAAETAAEPVTEEAAETAAEPAAEEAAEAAAEPAAEEAAEAAAEPAAEEAAETAAEPVAEEAAETAAEPVAEEAAEAAAEPVAEEAAEAAAEPVTEEAAEAAAEPVAPVQEPETPKGKEPEPETGEADDPDKEPPVEATEDIDARDLEKSGDFPDEEEGKAALLDVQTQVQDATSGRLIYSDTTTVGSGSRVRYSYTPSISSVYTFESVNQSGDAVGWITTAADENTVLERNDDGGTGLNFRVTLPLTAGTTYYLYARWYGSYSSGDMSIELYRQEEMIPLTADGSTVSVNIDTAGTMKYLTFTPQTSGSYTFQSVNQSGDTYGYLYDTSWNRLASNDDGGDGLNFLITYTLTGGTTYYYGVRWYSSSRTGTIDVQLTGGTTSDKVLGQPTESSPVTDYEDITENGQRKYFSFTPTVSGSYTFESTNTNYDPVGELYVAGSTSMVTSNDDGGDGLNFRIVRDLTAGTTYRFAVRFFGGSRTGRIDVRLSLTNADNLIPVVLSTQDVGLRGFATDGIDPAQTSNRAVRGGKGWFSFTPTVSGTYLFESTNNSGDPVAELFTSTNTTASAVTSNDDGGNANGNGSNFRLSYNLTQGTTYYYAVRWYGSSSSGTVNVRIRRSLDDLATPLAAGASATANIDTRGRVVYYSFTPTTTQEYTFESTSYNSTDANSFDPYVTLYDSDFNVIVTNDDGGSGLNFRITRTLTANTPYYFAVKRLNDSSTGTMEVRMSGNNAVTVIPPSEVTGSGWNGTAHVTAADSTSYFSFTPQTTDDYIFSSTLSSGDPVGVLYAGEPGSSTAVYSDDDGDGLNFSITRNLTAGTTYYFGVRWYSSSRTGDISVRMRKVSVNVIPLDAAAVESSGAATATGESTSANQVIYFSFRPSSTDTYVFESTNSSLDPYGYYYGENNPGGTALATNDDGGSGLNFRLSQRLTAGTTYYYGARFLFGNTGTLNVRMSKGTSTTVDPTAVSVSLGLSTIVAGNQTTATAQITPANATNRSITWTSSNTSVATVNSSGIVTGVAEGTATITARTSNSLTGSATITVTPASPNPPSQRQYWRDYTYNFWNSNSDFGYPSDYRIPVERYMQLGYTRQQAEALYRSRGTWGGNCFGMSTSSILFFIDALHVENYDTGARVPHDFAAPRTDLTKYRKLRDMIELLQESQSMPIARYNQPAFNAAAVAGQLDQGNPVKFGIGGHAVVIYSYSRNGDTYTFNIYDNAGFVDTLTYTNSSTYQFTRNGQPARGSWRPANYCTADNIRTVYNAIKTQNNNGAANLLSVDGQDYIYIICPMDDLTLVNAQNQTATITNDILDCPEDMDIELVLPSIPQDATGYREDDTYRIVVPENTWRITGTDNLIIVGTDMSVDVNVTSSSHRAITISPDQRTIGVATENNEQYDVMYSLYNEYFDTLRVHGIAGEAVNISLKTDVETDGHVEVTGARTITAEVAVSDKTTTVEDLLDFEQAPTDFAIYWPVSGAGTENESASLTIRYPSEEMESASEDMEKTSNDAADGKDNQLATRSQAQKPSFGEPRLNSLTGSMELEIIKPDNTIVFYYTTTDLDAEMPNPVTSGQMYTDPILVTPNMRIVAVATRSGYDDSEVATWDYNQVAASGSLPGDVNGDGRVNNRDVGLLQQYLSGWDVAIQEGAADVNNDGRTNNRDVGLLQQYLSGWDVTLGPS